MNQKLEEIAQKMAKNELIANFNDTKCEHCGYVISKHELFDEFCKNAPTGYGAGLTEDGTPVVQVYCENCGHLNTVYGSLLEQECICRMFIPIPDFPLSAL